MIWKELDEKLIFIDIDALNSLDIMKIMGSEFIKYGYCKDSFIEALQLRENEYPTGIDIGNFGIAIPHTNITHINKSGIGIGILKNSVKFIHMGTDDEEVNAKIIFMLAIEDSNTHIEKIQSIISIIQDRNILERLIKAENKKEIISIIKEKEMS